MARVKKIESPKVYKSEQCPQCRRLVPLECIMDKGLKCPRCGLFSWGVVEKAHKEVFDLHVRNPVFNRTKEG